MGLDRVNFKYYSPHSFGNHVYTKVENIQLFNNLPVDVASLMPTLKVKTISQNIYDYFF